MTDDFRRLLDERHDAVMAELQEANRKLDQINGRVRENEKEITKIKTVGALIQAAVLAFIGWWK